jgi:hypothetical protein
MWVHVPEVVDVRAIRQATGLSQARFAERFGFDLASIRNWEQGPAPKGQPACCSWSSSTIRKRCGTRWRCNPRGRQVWPEEQIRMVSPESPQIRMVSPESSANTYGVPGISHDGISQIRMVSPESWCPRNLNLANTYGVPGISGISQIRMVSPESRAESRIRMVSPESRRNLANTYGVPGISYGVPGITGTVCEYV